MVNRNVDLSMLTIFGLILVVRFRWSSCECKCLSYGIRCARGGEVGFIERERINVHVPPDGFVQRLERQGLERFGTKTGERDVSFEIRTLRLFV